jgi:hypothetical protein
MTIRTIRALLLTQIYLLVAVSSQTIHSCMLLRVAASITITYNTPSGVMEPTFKEQWHKRRAAQIEPETTRPANTKADLAAHNLKIMFQITDAAADENRAINLRKRQSVLLQLWLWYNQLAKRNSAMTIRTIRALLLTQIYLLVAISSQTIHSCMLLSFPKRNF